MNTAAIAPIWFSPSAVLPPTQHRRGLVRAEGRRLFDDGGAFRPLGATLFWAPIGWHTGGSERARVKENLAYLARYHFDFIRILGSVGWGTDAINPAWPDYDALMSDLLDTAFREFGLRTEVTLWGGGSSYDPVQLARRWCDIIASRPECVLDLECSNESYNNGPDSPTLREMMRVLIDGTPHLVAPSCCPGGAVEWFTPIVEGFPRERVYVTGHLERKTSDKDWRFVRQNWDWRDLHWAGSGDENKGPRSSIAECVDPLRLTMDRALGVVCGLTTHILHNGAGVSGQPDPNHNRPPNLWEVPGIDAIMAAVRGLDAYLPAEGVEDWTKANNGWSAPNPEPIIDTDHFWSDADPGYGCNKCYHAVHGGQFITIPCGILNHANFIARRTCYVQAVHPITGAVVFDGDVAAHASFTVPGDADANTSYIITGQAL